VSADGDGAPADDVLLDVDDLHVTFPSEDGKVMAVRGSCPRRIHTSMIALAPVLRLMLAARSRSSVRLAMIRAALTLERRMFSRATVTHGNGPMGSIPTSLV
jgi:hypothetical protein